jgi:hypothetical protein
MKYEKIIKIIYTYYSKVQFVFTFLKECGYWQARILRITVTILKHVEQHEKVRRISTHFYL